MRIADLTPENRPRERLRRLGPESLSDAELLAIILQQGTRKENALELAHHLLASVGLHRLGSCSLKEVQTIKGIGFAKAAKIAAAVALGVRSAQFPESGQVRTPQEAFVFLAPLLAKARNEMFMVLHLNVQKKVIHHEVIASGSDAAINLEVRDVLWSAIKERAHSILVAHNHPSGDPYPSAEDEELTARLFAAGAVLGVRIVDHLIIGKDKWYSFSSKEKKPYQRFL